MSEWIGLRAGDLSLALAPAVGGSIARFDLDRDGLPVPLMRPADLALADPLLAACFPLVPFSNRVRDGRFAFAGRKVTLPPNMPGQKHPLHGQGWRNGWRAETVEAAFAELSYRHLADAWPWTYEARQTFALDAAGLSVTLSVRNLSDEVMPAGLGLHPYFPCGADTLLNARVGQVWTVDDEIMPQALEPAAGRYNLRQRRICGAGLDNGFEGWDGRARLTWPDRGVALDILSPLSSRLQVYAPPEGGLVVAEPVTNGNAALNAPPADWPRAGLVLLAPDEQTHLDVRFDLVDPAVPPSRW